MATPNLLRNALILRSKPLLLKSFCRTIFATSKNFEKKNELLTLEPFEIATGMYKRDILDRLSTPDDPFSVKTIPHGPGSEQEPNMIPSAYESRMVGCICEEDSPTIVWMWLTQGEAKRCQCGLWFKLYHEDPIIETNSIPMS